MRKVAGRLWSGRPTVDQSGKPYIIKMSTSDKTDRYNVRVNDREQLIYLLTEAAEIEHGLMCTYLYAGWSLKQAISEGLTSVQLETVNRWRKEIRGVAMEEMAHLATVNNLLMSIGASPHFRRQNFPVPAGYHPSSLVVRLAPLNRETLAHFVYLERPEGMDMSQAKGFESAFNYERRSHSTKLTPTSEDFDTIGHLYHGIRHGFEELTKQLGESELFTGTLAAQMGPEIMDLPGLEVVTDLSTALKAIEVVVEQGEGGHSESEGSHFARFITMSDEYDAFLSADPCFVPHREVVSDPVMFAPIGEAPGYYIDAPDSAVVLDVANAIYGLMLRLLASGTGFVYTSVIRRRAEIDRAVGLMHVLHQLSIVLTTLPASTHLVPHAGMNFHLPRSALALPQREASVIVLGERANEIALALELLSASCPAVSINLSNQLRAVAASLIET